MCWWCCYLPKKWSVRKYYRRHLYRLWEKKYVQICMQTYVLTLRTCTKYGRFWHLHTHTHCCLLITIAEEEEEKIVGSCRPSKSTILLRHLMPTFDISFTRNFMTLLLFSHGDIFFQLNFQSRGKWIKKKAYALRFWGFVIPSVLENRGTEATGTVSALCVLTHR